MCQVSHVRCHISCVMFQVSCVVCHLSQYTFHYIYGRNISVINHFKFRFLERGVIRRSIIYTRYTTSQCYSLCHWMTGYQLSSHLLSIAAVWQVVGYSTNQGDGWFWLVLVGFWSNWSIANQSQPHPPDLYAFDSCKNCLASRTVSFFCRQAKVALLLTTDGVRHSCS